MNEFTADASGHQSGICGETTEAEGEKGGSVQVNVWEHEMLDFMDDPLLGTDTEGNIICMNRAAETVTGFRRTEAVGRRLQEIFRIIDVKTRTARANIARQAMDTDSIVGLQNGDLLITRDGLELPVENTATPLHDVTGKVRGALVRFRDSRYTVEMVARMAYLAQHDFLTGLLNRHAFAERFEQALALAQRHQKKMVLLFIDLDDFKEVNDFLGHDSGDALLKALAHRLLDCVRVTDPVCRYGGDEFVVLLSDLEQHEQAAVVIDKLRRRAAEPLRLAGHEISLRLSIGFSLYPDDGDTLEAFLPHADAAMYRAKASHRSGSGKTVQAVPALLRSVPPRHNGVTRASPPARPLRS
jgi:diguanylate cyclase (GGDEF)-like protein/PAS domain S-box-containing protein